MATSALQSLAQISPNLYLNESTSSGTSVLANLHDQCGSAGLLSTSVGDDAERLYGVFNVALEHGLGSLVLDYVAQVSFGSGFHPDHPSSAILSDPQCVAAWLQSSLAAARYDLSTALAQGLSSIASSQIAPRHVAKLQTLVMVAESLASKSFSTAGGPIGSSARIARRILTTGGAPPALGLNTPTTNRNTSSAPPETSSALVTESNRLLQTAKIMHWLSTQQLRQTNPSGRFSSLSAWQGTVSRRRAGAGSTPLLFAELLDDVMKYDVDVVSYPPPSPESFITTLFLSGNATPDAFQSKLALLSYCLVDANFFTAPDLARSIDRLFHIPPSVTYGWMLLLFLDDAQLIPADAPVNSSLNQAINCLPGVHGPTIPFRALGFFVDRGRGDVALGLLRQRSQKEISTGDIVAACTALRVRLANGLLVESFIEMKRYLQLSSSSSTTSITSGGDVRASQKQQQQQQREKDAQRLIEELLTWGSSTQGGLHGIISLPIAPAHEEPALISWLQQSTHCMPSAGIMLTLYFLMRGRTPEALLAYAQYGNQAASAAAAAASAADNASSLALEEASRQVEELLHAASHMMPAAQRALVVGTAAEPALRFSGEDQEMSLDGGDGGSGGGGIGGVTALVSALPGLDTGGLPMLISSGPTAAESPLVGGVMAAIAKAGSTTAATAAAQGRKEKGGEGGVGGSPKQKEMPLLFGQTPGPGSGGAVRSAASTPLGTQFGATLTQGAAVGAGVLAASTGGRRQQHHQLDALLGLTATGRMQATGMKGRRTLR